jgi:acetolactate decarboxylase
MKKNKHSYYYSVGLILISFLFTSCSDLTNGTVEYSGALKTMMSGDLKATVSLDTLLFKKHLYALGALENLKGEIQIFDGKPNNSIVADSTIQINDSYVIKAALLVYTEVSEWKEFTLVNITTKDDLEKKIFENAKSNGINIDEPFPFLLEGQVSVLDWHVINWKDGDTIHTHNKHKESGLNGSIKNRKVEIIGFYSTKHKAIFTHHSTNMHMHFKTDDNKIAGHIDDLILGNNVLLKLPK